MISPVAVVTVVVCLCLYVFGRGVSTEQLASNSPPPIEDDSRTDDELHEQKEKAVAEERYLDAERIRVILRSRKEMRRDNASSSGTSHGSYLVQFSGRKSVVKMISPPVFDDFVHSAETHRACGNATILSITYVLLSDPSQEPLPLTALNFNDISPHDSLITVQLESECAGREHVELEGAVVKWGTDNIVPSAESCCRQCREFIGSDGTRCNAWVYCNDKEICEKQGVYQQCWLKYQSDPENTPLRGSGPANPWTSGSVVKQTNLVHQQSLRCTPIRFKASDTQEAAYLTRSCGSPATNAYENISNSCLVNSSTYKTYTNYLKANPPSSLECYRENHVSYDGVTVVWGLGNKKNTAEECALSCINYKPRSNVGVGSDLPCNEWVFCPKDTPVCFEPDAHKHTAGDCWLRFTEHPQSPEINMRGTLPDDFKTRHPSSPDVTSWISGVLLLPNTPISPGVWGPRSLW